MWPLKTAPEFVPSKIILENETNNRQYCPLSSSTLSLFSPLPLTCDLVNLILLDNSDIY